jgi:hypothetical protein
MINRPSYAQRTLDLTRRSLQLLPPVPPVPPVREESAAPDGDDVAMAIDVARDRRAAPLLRSLDLGRWRRKAAPTASTASMTPIRTTPTVARRLVR